MPTHTTFSSNTNLNYAPSNHATVRYILYARKSEEDKNRQVQSIGDQVKELHRLAERHNLHIVDEICEEHSAKAPGRPLFNILIDRIRSGEADGILVWSINRLLRNPVDHGTISWMLQQGQIRSVQTMDKEYLPGDNVVLLSVESAVANQFIIDLRKNTLRGIASKVEKGWFPHKAPLGYRNDVLAKTIAPDPERFAILRQGWDMLLSGGFTGLEILRVLNDELGLRVPATDKKAGGPLARSSLYNLFGNIFYAGYFKHGGMLHKGKHEPMVTLDEFMQAAGILSRELHRQPQKRTFAFTGLIRCGECGQGVTAEIKNKLIRSTNDKRTYVYYRCSDSFGRCHKRGVREEVVARQIDELLERITILPEFKGWGLEELQRWHDESGALQQTAYEQKQQALIDLNRQLDNLLDLRLKNIVGDDDYTRKRDDLVSERNALHIEANHVDEQGDHARDTVENVLNFATHARAWFATGDTIIRRIIAQGVGAEFMLKDKRITIKPNPLLVPILEDYPRLEKKYHAKKGVFEPQETGSQSRESRGLHDVRLSWGHTTDNTRTIALEQQLSFPNLSISFQTTPAISPVDTAIKREQHRLH